MLLSNPPTSRDFTVIADPGVNAIKGQRSYTSHCYHIATLQTIDKPETTYVVFQAG